MDELIRSVTIGVLSAVIFLLLFLGANWNFLFCVLLSGGVFTSVSLLTKPRRKIGEVLIEDMANGEQLEQKLKEAKEDFRSIQRSMGKIEDSVLKEQAKKLTQISSGIIKYLEKHPDKILVARRFIDYYQETASSLLKKYVELQETKLETEEVRILKEHTKQAIGSLNVAFDNQFQKLMNDELMDMEAEIKLIEQTMKMDDK